MELNRNADGSGWALYLGCSESNGGHYLGALSNPDSPSQMTWDPNAVPVTAVSISDDITLITDINGPVALERYAMVMNQMHNDPTAADLSELSCCTIAHDLTAYHDRSIASSGSWTAVTNPFQNHN